MLVPKTLFLQRLLPPSIAVFQVEKSVVGRSRCGFTGVRTRFTFKLGVET